MNKEKATIYVSVLLSSGTTCHTTDYKIENAIKWTGLEEYYYIKTEDDIEYCFPKSRTILKICKK